MVGIWFGTLTLKARDLSATTSCLLKVTPSSILMLLSKSKVIGCAPILVAEIAAFNASSSTNWLVLVIVKEDRGWPKWSDRETLDTTLVAPLAIPLTMRFFNTVIWSANAPGEFGSKLACTSTAKLEESDVTSFWKIAALLVKSATFTWWSKTLASTTLLTTLPTAATCKASVKELALVKVRVLLKSLWASGCWPQ